MPTTTQSPNTGAEIRPLPAEPMTYEQFLVWADEDVHAEWANGKAVLRSPVSREHSGVAGFLYRLIAAFVESCQISPESRGRDRGEKFYEYEEGGVKEYWLIDPPRKKTEFYQLGPDGYYRPMEVRADGRFQSIVLPGFWLTVDWLWQRPLPTLTQVMKEWGLN